MNNEHWNNRYESIATPSMENGEEQYLIQKREKDDELRAIELYHYVG
jgi:hypothetical protein